MQQHDRQPNTRQIASSWNLRPPAIDSGPYRRVAHRAPRKEVPPLRDHFSGYLEQVQREGRYRTFIDLERRAERPPYAIWRSNGASREVVVWCSNDYLGM